MGPTGPPCYLVITPARCGKGGEWGLHLFPPGGGGGGGGPLRLAERGVELGEVLEMVASPTEAQVAVATHDLRLLLVDLRQGTLACLDSADFDGGIFDLAWSHDGAWLAYAVSTSAMSRTSAIRLCHVPSRRVHALTDGHFADTSPCWDPEAHFIAFLSSRCLRAVEDALFASLNFTHAQRPYLAMLTADAPSPLAPPPRQPGWEPPEEELGEDEESEDDGDAMPEVRVEPRGLSQRLTAVPRYLVITPLGAR